MEKAAGIKQTKANELTKQREHLEKEIADHERDVTELEKCKSVLATEVFEETAYQEQMRILIAQLKRNIYEVKQDREKMIKEIAQGKKIITNLQCMKGTLTDDKDKMQADFNVAFDDSKKCSKTAGKGHDLTATQIKSNMSTISKLSATQHKRTKIPVTAAKSN